MKAMETLQDLIEEAKIRTVWWAICVFGAAYFLSHTSKSLWTNIPLSILILSVFRLLSHEVEIRWRVRPVRQQTYISHLRKKQLSVNDPRLSSMPAIPSWKRKIDSPLVEAAIDDFINKILQDFVIDLWYSAITPDKEAPELMRLLINDALGEICGRVKEINLFDLLTRDMVDLIGNHLDLYRRNQSSIGADVMGALSFDERDERLKQHLIASKELHPALLSSECEYKVLQRLVGAILAVVLRKREAQCPLVRCIGRELLTCLVVQPVMNFASPGYVNELIEFIFFTAENDRSKEAGDDKPTDGTSHRSDNSVAVGNTHSRETESSKTVDLTVQRSDMTSVQVSNAIKASLNTSEHGQLQTSHTESLHYMQHRSADWARVLDAATQRRTQVLAPENLENLWTKGRNYKKKVGNHVKAGTSSRSVKNTSGIIDQSLRLENSERDILTNMHGTHTGTEDKLMLIKHGLSTNTQDSAGLNMEMQLSQDRSKEPSFEGGHLAVKWEENTSRAVEGITSHLKRSSSTSALRNQPDVGKAFLGEGWENMGSKEFCSPNLSKHMEEPVSKSASEMAFHNDGSLHVSKIKCRVVGAYFEKIGSKSFAVYSIAVTDADNKTWFVKRRYRNFERLHRHLKDIPNYGLHLPPKRFLSSSIDDYFVHQRCILLDKYLQDLLSIANVAEQHEVWDFLSMSSKNYSFGKSTSVMKTLAVNVDDAMDDIVRQFKGVSDGLRRKVVGPVSLPNEADPIKERHMTLSWNEEDSNKHASSRSTMETSHSLSDNEDGVKDGDHGDVSIALTNGWHSDNELNSKSFPPRVVKHVGGSGGLSYERGQHSDVNFDRSAYDTYLAVDSLLTSDDSVRVPPEWTPANVSVPLLNLVDKIFQLNRRGWLRRQVFWISKQILQLMMEDAIDDWLLRQIHWLRRDDIIAQGIRWVQDVLWPDGKFFLKLESSQEQMDDIQFSEKSTKTASHSAGIKIPPTPGSFERQLEAARRASDVKKMVLGGAPTALVGLIGHKQYRRCAKDVYFFLQSTVCVKQLAYGMLELLIVSVFPEVHDVIVDIHEKKNVQPAA